MIERPRHEAGNDKPPAEGGDSGEQLPFSVELWSVSEDAIERMLARALSTELARAIYKAAQTEYPGRRVTLSRSRKILLDSAD